MNKHYFQFFTTFILYFILILNLLVCLSVAFYLNVSCTQLYRFYLGFIQVIYRVCTLYSIINLFTFVQKLIIQFFFQISTFLDKINIHGSPLLVFCVFLSVKKSEKLLVKYTQNEIQRKQENLMQYHVCKLLYIVNTASIII